MAFAATLPAGQAGATDEPWYEDVGSHWSYEYVRTLWEEDVTDGELRREGKPKRTVSYYYPSEPSTRAQYSAMLAKVFRLSPRNEDEPRFIDVPEAYQFFNKPMFGYIQAAALAGIIEGYPNGTFLPDAELTREQAFALLIRALDLQPYAESLRESDVSRILRRFPDYRTISRSLEREIAAAAYLGIVEGYPDGTLRPYQAMTRAEAATVVYRSCLVRASAVPAEFSPDGDGFEDQTRFDIQTLKNRNTRWWNLLITDYWGSVFRSMYNIEPGPPPGSLPWDGTSGDGTRLPDGTYYYRMKVTDRKDQEFWTVMKPVVLTSRSLSGSVHPPVLQPGEVATVTGYATGQPAEVSASTPWTGYRTMPEEDRCWRLQFTIPVDARDGDYAAELRAVYTGTTRSARAPFRVEQVISIDGYLDPNPCAPGDRITVGASSTPNVVQVEASCGVLGVHALRLDRCSQPDTWAATFLVPVEAQPGRYPVTVTARTHSKSRSTDLDLLVNEDPLESVTFSLTG